MLASYVRKIRCPRHYLLKPTGVPYVMERIPSLRNIKEKDAIALAKNTGMLRVKLWRPKKDKFGNKIQNFKDYYQPEVSPAEMRMRVFDPLSTICQKCKRCVTA